MITTMMSGDSSYQNLYSPYAHGNAIGHQRAITKSSAPARDSQTVNAANWNAHGLHAPTGSSGDKRQLDIHTASSWDQWQTAPTSANMNYAHSTAVASAHSGYQYPSATVNQQFGVVGQSRQTNPNIEISQNALHAAADVYQRQNFVDNTAARSPLHLAIQSLPMDSSRPLFCDEVSTHNIVLNK